MLFDSALLRASIAENARHMETPLLEAHIISSHEGRRIA